MMQIITFFLHFMRHFSSMKLLNMSSRATTQRLSLSVLQSATGFLVYQTLVDTI